MNWQGSSVLHSSNKQAFRDRTSQKHPFPPWLPPQPEKIRLIDENRPLDRPPISLLSPHFPFLLSLP